MLAIALAQIEDYIFFKFLLFLFPPLKTKPNQKENKIPKAT